MSVASTISIINPRSSLKSSPDSFKKLQSAYIREGKREREGGQRGEGGEGKRERGVGKREGRANGRGRGWIKGRGGRAKGRGREGKREREGRAKGDWDKLQLAG